ncbi:MAG: MgtC/SapB family protein [Aquificae bacterium]|nr:MgtC/SapB family protein [Aquificota bacterium]
MYELLKGLPESYPFPFYEALLRVVLSALIGAVIGLERERRKQPAGLRTHAVLSVGSCLITLVSIYTAYEYGGEHSDPTRITAQIVSGIGFLGAGAILRFGLTVKGLTTAASLWSTAGLGMAVGSGMYVLSVFTTLVMLFLLSMVSRIEKEVIGSKGELQVRVRVKDSQEALREVIGLFGEGNLQKLLRKEGELELIFKASEHESPEEKLEKLSRIREVREVEVL